MRIKWPVMPSLKQYSWLAVPIGVLLIFTVALAVDQLNLDWVALGSFLATVLGVLMKQMNNQSVTDRRLERIEDFLKYSNIKSRSHAFEEG